MAFMPEFAPFVVLGFLAMAALVAASAVAVIFLWLIGKRMWIRFVLAGLVSCLALYAIVLVGDSLASKERVLRLGEFKYFCEIDCHLALSVLDVHRSRTVGDESQRRTAAGMYTVVTMQAWFDEHTISPRRPLDAPLFQDARKIVVVDRRGNEYPYDPDLSRQLSRESGEDVPFTRPIHVGEKYSTHLVFDLPADIEKPRLLITCREWETHLLIGHELSPLHPKIWFALE